MCGISGVIAKKGEIDVKETVHRMNVAITHRGPDGEGFFYDENYGLALGHRRLSIIDLTQEANQPMFWKDKYVIIYNGEIYNYIELREELINQGYVFHTKSDTEVILAAYDCWGFDCFNRFNGMWAISIFDREKKQIVLCRDRFGIKPIYYYENDDVFLFCSEIKQIKTCINQLSLNQSVFFDYLYLDCLNHTPDTFYSEIKKVEAATYMLIDLFTHKTTIKNYYTINADKNIKQLSNDAAAATQYIDLLKDSIKLRLRSDVRVGTCLSGGLDSSFIASIASKSYQSLYPFTAITAKSSEKSSDETMYASMVAKNNNINHVIVKPDKQDYDDILFKVIDLQDEPFGGPSIIMQYFVMQEAKKQGCIVMLDGQGGDETLLGYERYYFSAFKKMNFLKQINHILQASKNSKLSLLDALKYKFYFSNIHIRHHVLKKRFSFIKEHYLQFIKKELISKLNGNFDTVEELQKNELKLQLAPLLNYEDKNSMSHSVEARLPFLDYRVIEAAIALPLSMKIHNGWTKYILRLKSKDILPDEIAWRKNKFGFQAPMQTWLQNKENLKREILSNTYIKEILQGDKLPFNNLYVMWRLYNFSIWSKRNNLV